jgi:hypothetical protein
VAGFCGHRNKYSVFTKCGKFLDLLINYQFIKKDSTHGLVWLVNRNKSERVNKKSTGTLKTERL